MKTTLQDFDEKRSRKAATMPIAGPRRRVVGEIVTVTTRMPKAHWKRLRELALHEGETLQTITMRGYDLVLREKRLPPLE